MNAKVETTEIRPCQCSNYADAETGARLVCNRTTLRDFAPGHDARLKGFLIKVGAQGHKVTVIDFAEDMDAVTAASFYQFAHMVASGIERAKAKAFERMIRETKRQARKTHETPKQVAAKVGRWVYQGVTSDDPIHGPKFTYQDRKGNQQTTTKFTLI